MGKLIRKLFKRSFYPVKTLAEYIAKVKDRLTEFGYKTNNLKTEDDVEGFLKEKGFIGKKEVKQ